MGSIHNSASTSSMSSSSSSETCQGNSSSKHQSKRKSQQPVSVAALRSHFEGLKSPTADERVPNCRRSGRGALGSTEAVEGRSSKRRSTSAGPAGARSSLGTGSTAAPVNRGRPVTPVCGRSQQQEITAPRADYCGHTKYDAGVESILKKHHGQVVSTDSRTSGSVTERTRRPREETHANGHAEDLGRSNGSPSNSRRVLFKNNVSVYRFDADPLQTQNIAVSGGSSRRPTRQNVGVVRSKWPSHDAIVRPPTLSSSHDPNRRRVHAEQLNLPLRRTETYDVHNSFVPSSTTDVVGEFEVFVDHQRGNHRLIMTVALPVACRHIDADRLTVKANRCGTRIRVTSEPLQNGRRFGDYDFEELDEQFTLPVIVDPYGVAARLEYDGKLVIEAPVAVL